MALFLRDFNWNWFKYFSGFSRVYAGSATRIGEAQKKALRDNRNAFFLFHKHRYGKSVMAFNLIYIK